MPCFMTATLKLSNKPMGQPVKYVSNCASWIAANFATHFNDRVVYQQIDPIAAISGAPTRAMLSDNLRSLPTPAGPS